MKRIIFILSMAIFFCGCISPEEQRQNLIVRFQRAYPEVWQQKLLEYDLLYQLNRQQNRPPYQPHQYSWQQQQLNDQLNQIQLDHTRQQFNDFEIQNQLRRQHNDQVLQNWKRDWNRIQQERQRIQRQYWPK